MHIPSTITNSFFQHVEDNDTICIFRHENPDGDAFGSQCGLRAALLQMYPDKSIYVLGEDPANASLFPKMDSVDDAIVAKSLAIVLDCANRDRIDDKRYATAQTLIKIDHHIEVDVYGDLSYVDAAKSSTCEMITGLLKDKNSIDATAARYLLAGMMTDTIRFSVESTTSDTLRLAAYLMDCGANITTLNRTLFSKNLDRFQKERELAPYIQYEGGVASLIIPTVLRESLGLSVGEAKLYNSIMAGIQEFKIWAIFVEDENGQFMGSLRSQTTTINTIAELYNGGGHRLACGVRNLSRESVSTLIDALKTAVAADGKY